MDSRTRLLTVLHNEKPDRLPCQVHSWMPYYLEQYLNGLDQYEAYARFGMDAVVYTAPIYSFNERSKRNWQVYRSEHTDPEGQIQWREKIVTPEETLTTAGGTNQFTTWTTEYIIKSEADFEIWNKYVPIPESVDWSPVLTAKEQIGNKGIVRGILFDFGQGSPWQSFCCLFGTEEAILATFDQPDWVHYVLQSLLDKKLRVIERAGKFAFDLVETGGGHGSNTVISPSMHREFCLPYDQKQHEAIHNAGSKVVYHLCGGLMQLLDLVVENGADGLETMTPPSMGGDCDLALANQLVGDRLFFIGGFDQNRGFEKGNPTDVKKQVYELHAACPDGGYICSPSDHFFFGSPENLQAFADACKECIY
ncbi:MAG: hypothetical protein M0Q40_00015 [Limnochordia bacterium]|nr:hypothetical protein [Limnochordia bacterium]